MNDDEVVTPRTYLLANVALAAAQISFGISTVIGELGLPAVNPVLFGFVREGIAGPMLVAMALFSTRNSKYPAVPRRVDVPRYALCGAALFVNQFCAITGIKLAGAVAQSVWQPTQPIMSLILALLIGYEKFSLLKVLGILFAFASVTFMVLFDAEDSKAHSTGAAVSGNILFFTNCMGAATYVVASKPLLRNYTSLTVTGFSYMFASVMMGIACVIVNSSDVLLRFVCPPSDDDKSANRNDSCGNGWSIPVGAVGALVYWILMTSIFSYCLITWGNKYADASLVSAYSVLQPVSTAVTTFILIAVTGPPHFNLHGPNLGDLGVVGIFLGLSLVIFDAKRKIQDTNKSNNANAMEGSTPKRLHSIADVDGGVSRSTADSRTQQQPSKVNVGLTESLLNQQRRDLD
eukprot:c1738_g1_i1.p1 GENE.c1738_g1_i1~~c1738_g1_i1.p1  ORF type:complete len:419 (+),score=98.14 c1738_g1_i1:44-1258(+)